ncbi:MAG: B3/4 domain-containing protein [Cyclobacteriaceae bacterium]
MSFTFSTDQELKKQIPEVSLVSLQADVKVYSSDETLLEEIHEACEFIRQHTRQEDISSIEAIALGRQAYKTLGKDPARYRLSAEALLRRIIGGKDLYQINNVVDLLNLVSLRTGISIGGFDVDKITGNISLGIGKENEPYEAIGRGQLNIHYLPVLRDATGAFGTPTSDAARTSVSADTRNFLMVIISYSTNNQALKALEMASDLLKKYAGSQQVIINEQA